MKVKLAVLDFGGNKGVVGRLFRNWNRMGQDPTLLDLKIFFMDQDHDNVFRNRANKKLFRRSGDFIPIMCAHQGDYWYMDCPVDTPRSIVMTTRESLLPRGEGNRDMCLLTTTFLLRETANEADRRSDSYVRHLVITLGETRPMEDLPKKHPMQLQQWMLTRKEPLVVDVDCEVKDRQKMKGQVGAFIRDVEVFNGPIFFDDLKNSNFDGERIQRFIKGFHDVDKVLRRSQDMMNQVGRPDISTLVGLDLVKQYRFPLHRFFSCWEGAARTQYGAQPFECLAQA